MVKENGKEPTVAGTVVNAFFTDYNYIGKYIEFRVYSSEKDYPKGTPAQIFQVTPDYELVGTVNKNINYTLSELKALVEQKKMEPVEFLLNALTNMSQHQKGGGIADLKYLYSLKKDAPITGSVIRELISKKKYAVIRDYYSEDAYAAGADPLNSITITPDTKFSKTIFSEN